MRPCTFSPLLFLFQDFNPALRLKQEVIEANIMTSVGQQAYITSTGVGGGGGGGTANGTNMVIIIGKSQFVPRYFDN